MVFGTCKRRRMFYVTDLFSVLKPKPRRKPTGEMLRGMMKGLVLYWAALVSFVPTRKQRREFWLKLKHGVSYVESVVSLSLAICLSLVYLWALKNRSR